MSLRRLLLTNFATRLRIVPGLLQAIFGRLLASLLFSRGRGLCRVGVIRAFFGHNRHHAFGMRGTRSEPTASGGPSHAAASSLPSVIRHSDFVIQPFPSLSPPSFFIRHSDFAIQPPPAFRFRVFLLRPAIPCGRAKRPPSTGSPPRPNHSLPGSTRERTATSAGPVPDAAFIELSLQCRVRSPGRRIGDAVRMGNGLTGSQANIPRTRGFDLLAWRCKTGGHERTPSP
jgi:hypothetical protein